MHMLPIVTVKSKHYFVDMRLHQLRNTSNPHDYIDFHNQYHLLDYLKEAKAKTIKREVRI